MNLELNCEWHFAQKGGGRDDGPNDPMQDNFKRTPYASLIRESIQNSMDACMDDSKPVRVEFTISRIQIRDYENFFKLKRQVEGCLNYFSNNNDAKATYQPIIDCFSSLERNGRCSYIKVADYNTRGMKYIKGNTDNPFYAFVRAAGVAAKGGDKAAGGAFGFGKAAYYYISPLRTIFVSTKTPEGEYFFEGASSLCTHTLEGEEGLFEAVGYYDNNNGEPVTNIENIPVRFRREEPGTDICIFGIDASDKTKIFTEMIEAVLRNFWMAIQENKLEVKIDNLEIKKDNLWDIMVQFLPSEQDTVRRELNYSPRPYLDAVINAGKDNRHLVFEDNLPTIGHVRFYAVKTKKATDKILYMRKPLMLVKARRTNGTNGFYGVFICDDPKGNEYLRKTENPAHNEWKSSNWRVNGKIWQKGRDAIDAVDQYVIKITDQMFSNSQSNVQDIKGLEEFLYIPTAVEDDDIDSESQVGDVLDNKKDEGNSPSTELSGYKESNTNSKPAVGKVIIESSNTRHKADAQGQDLSGHGTRKKKTRGGGGAAGGKIDGRYTESEQGVGGRFLTEVPVKYRSFAQTEKGVIVHNIIIHSDYEFLNGRIDLKVGGDQSDDIVPIKDCTMPGMAISRIIKDNTISGLHIKKGKNILKIQFADNMKHAIKLDAYELK